jgi:hypothetical protein
LIAPPTRTPQRVALGWSLGLLGIGLLTPSLVIFGVDVTVGGIQPAAAVAHLFQRQFAQGHNLFSIALLGLVPFAVLSTVCFVASRRLPPARLACVVLGGLLGILGLMVHSHAAVWYPLYRPGRISSSAVIAFLFIPFYCLATLSAGLLVGWLVSLLAAFRRT